MTTTFYLIVTYAVLINLITFGAYGWDKYKAKAGSWRIPEKTLLLLTAVGGSMGALLGMKVFHHKTMHKKFYIGVPLILVLQLLLIGWIVLRLSATPMPIA